MTEAVARERGMLGSGTRRGAAWLLIAAALISVSLLPTAPATEHTGTATPEPVWAQDRDTPSRDGVAPTTFPLDRIENGSLDRDGGFIAVSSQGASQGADLYLATSGEGRCRIHEIDVLALTNREVTSSPCTFYTLLSGLDIDRGHVITCRFVQTAQGDLLRAIDLATGDVVWAVSPDALLPAAPNGASWFCKDAVLHASNDRVYIAVQASSPGADLNSRAEILAAVNLTDGTVEASRTPSTATGILSGPLGSAETDQPSGVSTRGLAVADGDWLVRTGFAPCETCTGSPPTEGIVQWFSLPGLDHQASVEATSFDQTPGSDTTVGVSERATGQGDLFGAVLGDQVAIVNPAATAPQATQQVQPLEDPLPNPIWPTPVWTSSTLVVPFQTSILGLDASTLESGWGWASSGRLEILEVIGTDDGGVHVLLLGDEDKARLVTLSASTGRPIQALDLDVPWCPATQARSERLPEMVPVGERLIVHSTCPPFTYAVLGEGEPALAPSVSLDTQAPGVGETVTVTVAPPDEPSDRIDVHWGDGTNQTLRPRDVDGEWDLSHVYEEAGTHILTATTIAPDGETSTTARRITVGAPPQPTLNLLQEAFAKENQDLTFGLLGLAVALGGGAISLYRRRRRLSKLEQELDRLEEIRAMAREDPREGVRQLETFRDRIETELAEGQIDDGQFSVLEIRTDRLTRLLRDRLLARFEDKLSAPFKRLLDATLEDGVITPTEADELQRYLHEEAIDQETEEALERILELWTGHARSRHPTAEGT